MSKFFQALLTGIFFTFILDFFIFLGIKQNYIDFYDIDVYYNILFADHQNIYIYAIFSLIIGYLIIYINNNKLSAIVVGAMFFVASLTLIPAVGHSLGEMILMKKNVILKTAKYTYQGDIYYRGRSETTFYDYKLQKTILFNNEELLK
ncbi:MAG: hypothetical protein AUK54_06125 [Helicobacteraceae bacterium CG2_30_36_10]|nr:MAG: hypothetical protein AUK54_06125 [Helicobacteraceae bacterium CG2_30_36_10]